MLKTSLSFADTLFNPGSIDALSQVLNSMRITGSLLIKEEYVSPWAVSVPHSNTLNTLLNTTTEVRVAAFHLVERGHIRIKLDDGEDVLVEAGEMVVCFSGQGHTLYQGSSQQVLPFQDIMAGAENKFSPSAARKGSGQKTWQEPSTSLVCGVFLLHDTLLNPLLTTLPNVLKINVSNPNDFPRLYGIVNLLIQEFKFLMVGNSYVVERYLEILCVEAIRAHVDTLSDQSAGWLSALKDPVVGRAIEVIHSRPGYNWSVKALASEAAISPSRFAARFTATLGESPMVYVSKWRMFVASKMLESNQKSIDQIANDVGYESMAAFSRAFKRHVGRPPAAWRARGKEHSEESTV